MTIKKILNLPLKNTIIAIVLFIAIFIMLRLPQLLMIRVLDAECNASSECVNSKSNTPVYIVLSDLIFLSRLLIEIGAIFLAAQLLARVISRK